MVVYGVVTMRNNKAVRAEELLTFAMWCGGTVTGPYMVVAAFNLSRQSGQQTNALYLGIFGTYLLLLSIQKLHSMLRKHPSKSPAPSVSEASEEIGPKEP